MAGPPALWLPVPLPLLSAAFALGVAAAASPPTEPIRALGAPAAAGALAACLVLLIRRVSPPAWLMVGAALCLGLARVQLNPPGPAPWQPPAARIELHGVIEGPVETRGASSTATLRVEGAGPGFDPPPSGARVHLVLPPLPPVQPGDQVRVIGRFEALSEHSPFERALLRQGAQAIARFPDLQRADRARSSGAWLSLQTLRSQLEVGLQRALPEPHASLIVGLVLGGREFSEELRQALVASGTSHLVVVSGYNISLVAAALVGLLRARRWLGTGLPLLGIWAFTLLAGAAPPSVRAAIMASVALLGLRLGRGVDPLGALGLTVAAMLAAAPSLAQELGFQLSALATLGLITLQPRIAALLPRLPGAVREGMAATLAAQLATGPVLVASFHQVSAIAPVSNLLAAPAIPAATIAGGTLAPLAALAPVLAPLVGSILIIPSAYLLGVVQATGSLPHALVPVGEAPPAITALYALGLLGWAALPTPEGRDFLHWLRGRPLLARATVAGAVGGALGALAASWAPAQPAALSLTIFDGGGAPAVLVRTPLGHTLLIDGGPSPSLVATELGRRLSVVNRQLAASVLTGTDGDRLPGAVLAAERYPPALALAAVPDQPSALFQRWRSAVGERLLAVAEPTTVEVEPGFQLELVPVRDISAPSPARPPSPGLVLLLTYDDVRVLFALGVSGAALADLARSGEDLRAQALVLGTAALGGSPPSWLSQIGPELVILTADPRARLGPDPRLLAALEGIETIRADLRGALELKSDGRRLWVEGG